MNGILIVDKPQGWTSHDVVNKARRVLQEKRIGHTGTLDPLATGVLVLCVGRATRIARYLEADDKEYTAVLRLGITTDTQDADGQPLETRAYPAPARDALETVIRRFQGEIQQVPPAYSALKVKGVPSYRLARAGAKHRHRERTVTIYAIDLLQYEDPEVRIRVHCSKGTYIRTLCADIGEQLGAGAHVTALNRERSGRFRIGQALSIEELERLVATSSGEEIMITMNNALDGLPGLRIPPLMARRISHGNTCPCPSGAACPADGDRVRVLDEQGMLIAVAVVQQGQFRPETVLV